MRGLSGSASVTTDARSRGPLPVVVVHTKTEQTIKGVLREVDPEGTMVLTSAALLDTDQNANPVWRPMDGDVVVPGSNVDFYQRGLDAELLAR